MNTTSCNKKRPIAGLPVTARIVAAVFVLAALLAASVQAAVPPNTSAAAQSDMFRPVLSPGGINAQSNTIINSLALSTNLNGTTNLTLNFHGLQAPYDLQAMPIGAPGFSHAAYTSVKYPNVTGSVTASNVDASSLFRLCTLGLTNYMGRYVDYTNFSGVSNVFVGSSKCNGCHGDKVTTWMVTLHAGATDSLKDTNGVVQPSKQSCLVCHTVGFGQSGGFLDITNTPHLTGVGCEDCHGPGNAHTLISGELYRPVRTIDPALCGGCHNGHNPQYTEYTNSLHAQVNLDNAYGVSSGTFVTNTLVTNGVTWNGYVVTTNVPAQNVPAAGFVNSINDITGLSRQMSCGPCHSGATRMAMLNNLEDRNAGITNNLLLPSGHDSTLWGPTCATCHDPHSLENPKQLRNPVRSTNYFTFFTGSVIGTNYGTDVFGQITTNVYYGNDVFASQYNPNIQICGQCHNSRGARWDGRSKTFNAASNSMVLGTSQSFSRGPHHSPQYNLLTGIVQDDYLNMTNNIGHPHSGLTASANTNQCATCHVPSYAVNGANVTGHTFALDTHGCALAGCHTTLTQDAFVAKIAETQRIQTNSITMVVGMLNQWATQKAPAILGTSKYGMNAWEYGTIGTLAAATNAGPSTADALKVPDAIKQARFNVYMVAMDQSLGVHNPTFIPYLLRAADTNISSQFPLANFSAKTVAGSAPFAVTFTNLGTGIATYSWDFGDGGTSASANPSHTYTTPGTYTVTFTANGTETLTRTAYIQVVNKPVVSFSAATRTVALGTPITFTNSSSNIGDVSAWRWTFNVTNSNTRVDTGYTPTYSYTYTNTGTFSVSLRASAPGGTTVTTTNAAYITVTP